MSIEPPELEDHGGRGAHMDRLHRMADLGRAYSGALWRGGLLGTALYVSLSPASRLNLLINAVFYLAAVAACHLSGPYARGRPGLAWVGGSAIYVVGIAVSNLLIMTLGDPRAV